MDVESVIPVKNKIMIEKWLLVMLIVGGTSLVFVICFPIDFYLYRRRKKLARGRMTGHEINTPHQVCRAGQYHAEVYPDNVTGNAELEGEKINDDKGIKKQNTFVRIVNLFRKRKTEQRLMQLQMLPHESNSESGTSGLPTVYINTEAHDDTSKSRNTDIPGTVKSSNQCETDLPGTVESSKPRDTDIPGNVESSKLKDTDIPGNVESSNSGEMDITGNVESQENVPYMAAALSVMMSENEELFGPESKHLNYGSTEKINSYQINCKIYQTLNKASTINDELATVSGGEHSLLNEGVTSTRGSVGSVLLQENGESCPDTSSGACNTPEGHATDQKRIIRVKSSDAKGSNKTVKRSKPTKGDDEGTIDKGIHCGHDIVPLPLPKGIATFIFSDSDDADWDKHAANSSSKQPYTDLVTNDGRASPLFRPTANSSSDQDLCKGTILGPRLNVLPSSYGVDEYDNGKSSIDIATSKFNLLDEDEISSGRRKKKKKGVQKHSANSLPNLSPNRSQIRTNQDYYKERRVTSASLKDTSLYRY